MSKGRGKSIHGLISDGSVNFGTPTLAHSVPHQVGYPEGSAKLTGRSVEPTWGWSELGEGIYYEIT